MRSFLGVPIVSPDGVIGAFYLTEKEAGPAFGAEEELIELLAAHAAIAITNARLYERSRELSMLAERNRLALELHDVVSQKLFSLKLSAQAAATLIERDGSGARAQVQRVQELAREALDELRSLILGLRPPETLQRIHGTEVALEVVGAPDGFPARNFAVLRIADEALHNALRHARARHVVLRLHAAGESLVVEVSDDGAGFDPGNVGLRARHLGLTSMEERARELGGKLEIRSGPGAGTTVRLDA